MPAVVLHLKGNEEVPTERMAARLSIQDETPTAPIAPVSTVSGKYIRHLGKAEFR